MSKRAFDKIMQGIKEAGAYLDGSADKSRYRVHVPTEVNVKTSRALTGSFRAEIRLRALRRP